MSILISNISDPLNNIKEAKRIKLLFSGWTLCSLCRKKKGSYHKIQQSDPEYKFLLLDLEVAPATHPWPQLPTPGPNQLRSLTKQIPSKVPPFPVGASTERAVVNTFNKCPGFGMDEISNRPRKYPTEFIWLIKLQDFFSLGKAIP